MSGLLRTVSVFAALGALFALASCGPSQEELEELASSSYSNGYRAGYSKAIAAIRDAGDSFRDGLRGKVEGKLFIFSIVAVALTLFGPALAEGLRKFASEAFSLEKADQILVAKWIYGIACSCTLIAGAASDWRSLLPISILLSGSLIPFGDCLDGIEKNDPQMRKTAVQKVKSLLFLSIVVVLLYRILGDGFGGLKISQ